MIASANFAALGSLTHCQIREKPTSRVAAAAARSATPRGALRRRPQGKFFSIAIKMPKMSIAQRLAARTSWGTRAGVLADVLNEVYDASDEYGAAAIHNMQGHLECCGWVKKEEV